MAGFKQKLATEIFSKKREHYLVLIFIILTILEEKEMLLFD